MRSVRLGYTSVLLFLLVFVVGSLLAPRVGVAWDESDNMFAGGVYWNFFRKGLDPKVFTTGPNESSYFGDRVYPVDRNIAHLPPVYNYVGTLFAIVAEHLGAPRTGMTVIVSYHIAGVLFFALLVATVYRFGRLLGLPGWASLFAAVSTFLYPTLLGHGLSNTKDIAQASLFTVALYYLVRAFFVKEQRAEVANKDFAAGSSFPRESSMDSPVHRSHSQNGSAQNLVRSPHAFLNICIGAVVWGLALATKFNAIYVPIIWVVGISSMYYGKGKKTLLLITYPLLLLLCVGFLTAFVVWPYLWFSPMSHIQEVVAYFTNVGRGYTFFWNGQMYQSGTGQAYWWYPPGSLLVGTPLPLLGLMVVGAIAVLWSWRRHPERMLLIVWILVPLARGFLPWAALYDGLRHFVEILPACMLLASIGLVALWRRGLRYPSALLAAVAIVQLLFIAVTYFPYTTGYYNALAPDPNKQFDRDVEALSLKEGIEYLHSRYGAVRVWVPIGRHSSWYYLRTTDRYVYGPDQADFIVFVNKSSHARESEYKGTFSGVSYSLDHTITRGGAVFGWVYKKL